MRERKGGKRRTGTGTGPGGGGGVGGEKRNVSSPSSPFCMKFCYIKETFQLNLVTELIIFIVWKTSEGNIIIR